MYLEASFNSSLGYSGLGVSFSAYGRISVEPSFQFNVHMSGGAKTAGSDVVDLGVVRGKGAFWFELGGTVQSWSPYVTLAAEAGVSAKYQWAWDDRNEWRSLDVGLQLEVRLTADDLSLRSCTELSNGTDLCLAV